MSSYEYNQLLKFLYFEGYADSYEDAEYIIEEMSDEELEEILEVKESYDSRYGRGERGEPRATEHLRVANPQQYAKDMEFWRARTRTATAQQRLKNKGKVPTKGGKPMFESVVEYLFVEGYADTIESAELMARHISEEWKNEIVEETLNEKLAKGTTGVSFATGKHKGGFTQAMTEKNPQTGRQRKTSPMSKAMGAHGRARSAQAAAERSGDTEAARRHKKRRDTIANVVYNKTNRIIDRADND